MSPNAQLRTCGDPLMEQPGVGVAGSIDHDTPEPEGSGSLMFTFVAVPAPVLKTVIVKPIWSPALTVDASAVFVMRSPGHCTDVVALCCTTGLFVACADAVFGYAAHGVSTVVGLETCTVCDAPAAMSPNEQSSACGEPPIEQPVTGVVMDHVIPAPTGSGSCNVTSLATPGPEFNTVIVNPMSLPSLTAEASAVLLMERFGQLTVVDALSCTEGAFDAAAMAVLSYVAQLAGVVPLVTWTDTEAPEATVPKLQCSSWFGAVPAIEQSGLAESIDQLMPLPPGRVSMIVTPLAFPAPVFVTVIVKPIGSPALTDALSAVFVICSAGHRNTVEAVSCTCALLDACALATFV
jgi:hypothetical protein